MNKNEAIEVVTDDHFELTKTGLKVKGRGLGTEGEG